MFILFFPAGQIIVPSLLRPESWINVQTYQMMSGYIFWGGFLGGCVFSVTSILNKMKESASMSERSAAEEYIVFVLTLFFRPFLGGTIALVIVLMLNSGFINFKSMDQIKESGSINFQISLSFIVGFSIDAILFKLNSMVSIIGNKAKDNSSN